MYRVKICGHTDLPDALESARLGADAVGVIVEVPVRTHRNLTASEAGEILRRLPSTVRGVAVIIPPSLDEALRLYREVNPSVLQLHGRESPEFVAELKSRISAPLVKTLHVTEEDALSKAAAYEDHCDALLLDTQTERYGGSGRTHNWEISREIVKQVRKPVLLAGGLTPENVREAILRVRPWGVDVASGVEGSDGKKDYGKVRRFVEVARGLL
jgi:phosphoribosylanthranilate isomerase